MAPAQIVYLLYLSRIRLFGVLVMNLRRNQPWIRLDLPLAGTNIHGPKHVRLYTDFLQINVTVREQTVCVNVVHLQLTKNCTSLVLNM